MPPIYRPLDSGSQEIRLLRLQPAPSFDAKIQGMLSYTSLHSPCEYEALSYRWGAVDFNAEIELEGQPFRITHNLEEALRHLRDETNERTIWVDAICINQYDTEERNHQVTLMKKIYTQCTTDLAWLGPDPGSEAHEQARASPAGDSNSPKTSSLIQGMELMKKMGEKDEDTLEDLNRDWEEWQEEVYGSRSRVKKDGRLVLLHKSQSVLDAVFRHPPLWSRIWVMQELSCAPRVVLVAGRSTLDWDIVANFLGDTPYSDAFHLVWSHGSLMRATSHTFERTQLIHHQRRISKDVAEGNFKSTLMDVLARFKFGEATDPRDKIYGLLGLVSEEHNIQVDYNKTVGQLFAEVCQYFIDSSGNLDIICQNPWQATDYGEDEHSNSNKLPAWVADFTLKNYSGIHDRFAALLFAQRGIFSAGSEACEVPCRVSEEGLALQAKAVYIGSIANILQHDYHEEKKMSRSYRSNLSESLGREWMALYFQKPSDIEHEATWASTLYAATGEPASQAYWRTLAMDCKAYPIQRLSNDDIAYDNALFAKIPLSPSSSTNSVDHSDATGSLSQMKSHRMMERNLKHWTFTVEANGLYCMIARGAQEGDVLAVLDGGKVPLILRPVDKDQSRLIVVGTAYVHGYMDGEALMAVEKGKLERRDIWLV